MKAGTSMPLSVFITGRNAQRGFHPTRNLRTGWYKVPLVVPLSPAMPVCTRVSAGMKPSMGLIYALSDLIYALVIDFSFLILHEKSGREPCL